MRHAIRAGILPAVIAVLALFAVPAHGVVFTNPAPITINDNAVASPYPSAINVSGLSGTITDVNVTLHGFSHTVPNDVSVALVAPAATSCAADLNPVTPCPILLLQNGAGDTPDVSAVNTTFDDSAGQRLPDLTAWTTGSYKPTAHCGGSAFPPPAPGIFLRSVPPPGCSTVGPATATLDSSFVSFPPNGTWNLFVMDSNTGGDGSIAGGWSIDISGGGPPRRTLTVIHSLTSEQQQLNYPESTFSTPPGILCGLGSSTENIWCAAQFRHGQSVELDGLSLGDWTGCDSTDSIGPACTVIMNSDRTVTWSFKQLGGGYVPCGGKKPTKVGGPGANKIKGTAGRDIIDAGRGNDTVNGKKGNDVICGGFGNDRLKGGAGKDTLKGDYGADILRGGAGKDQLNGDEGKDQLKGDEGRDSCVGGPGKDTTASC